MAFTIFYSWQSDILNRINRNFVEDALKKAIRKIGKDIEIQEALRDNEIELDKDTKGVPGTPPIVEVIFDKISNCGVFVPDLTFVGKTKEGRLIPNPNVLIEYGWALKELGHFRIVSIMNTVFGKPSSISLPFDMRHLRHPITYQLKEDDTQEERKKVKEKLTNDLSFAIGQIIKSGLLVQKDSRNEELSGLVPISNQNWIYLGRNKSEPNSSFVFQADFHLFVGFEDLTMLAFEGILFAYGCPCLQGHPRLWIGGQETEIHDDFKSFKQPYQIAAGSTLVVEYHREVRPPLRKDRPIDCESGDLKIKIRFREGKSLEPQTREYLFTYRPGGKLVPIERIRDVPRLGDKELIKHQRDGRISKHDLNVLLNYSAVSRYMAAVSDNPSQNFLDIPDSYRELLRTLL